MTTNTTASIRWETRTTVAQLGDSVAYITGEVGAWRVNVYNTAIDWEYGEQTFDDLSKAKNWAVNILRYYVPKVPVV